MVFRFVFQKLFQIVCSFPPKVLSSRAFSIKSSDVVKVRPLWDCARLIKHFLWTVWLLWVSLSKTTPEPSPFVPCPYSLNIFSFSFFTVWGEIGSIPLKNRYGILIGHFHLCEKSCEWIFLAGWWLASAKTLTLAFFCFFSESTYLRSFHQKVLLWYILHGCTSRHMV